MPLTPSGAGRRARERARDIIRRPGVRRSRAGSVDADDPRRSSKQRGGRETMMKRLKSKVIAGGVLVVVAAAVTNVAARPQTTCLVGKGKCVSKVACSLLKCEQRAETPGQPADPNFKGCIDKAKTRFDGGS